MLTGCGVSFKNVTPEQFSQNPSNRYAIAVKPTIRGNDVVRDSIRTTVVIDGNEQEMKLSPKKTSTYIYDYPMPSEQNEAKYYFSVNYDVARSGRIIRNYEQSPLYTLKLVNRYVLNIDVDRGPVGAPIRLIGRGFTTDDRIVVGGEPASTKLMNSNALEFVLPSLAANKRYPVYFVNAYSEQKVGDIHIDASEIHLNVESVELAPKTKTLLIFKIDRPAPKGGLDIDVTTNIPASINMPRVHIPEGSQTVSISIEGLTPNDGALFINAPGFQEKRVPIVVK
ncbi:MAG: hypothetical protein A2Y14_02140 [Verrucomicrobia bacterium GWF2_51_19]|nr:MAG: hypothetical protein A2Y14_02140 [Verrucomicrobia bacterium GWF2_51_19]HCJ12030.1 hypothetical protein [Opitutae bacterium]